MAYGDLSSHSGVQLLATFGKLAALAAEAGARRAYDNLRPKRRQNHGTRRGAGPDSPLWNVLAKQLEEELAEYGSKTRLANYLGVPRQRVTDFIASKGRLPDAELTLQLLFWLTERKAGRDPALLLPGPRRGRPSKPAGKVSPAG